MRSRSSAETPRLSASRSLRSRDPVRRPRLHRDSRCICRHPLYDRPPRRPGRPLPRSAPRSTFAAAAVAAAAVVADDDDDDDDAAVDDGDDEEEDDEDAVVVAAAAAEARLSNPYRSLVPVFPTVVVESEEKSRGIRHRPRDESVESPAGGTRPTGDASNPVGIRSPRPLVSAPD